MSIKDDSTWYGRHSLLFSVGAELNDQNECKEGEIITANFRGITLRFPYTEDGTERCFYALLKAEDLRRYPIRRFVYKLFHRAPKQNAFDMDNSEEWEKAVRAALDRMPPVKKG